MPPAPSPWSTRPARRAPVGRRPPARRSGSDGFGVVAKAASTRSPYCPGGGRCRAAPTGVDGAGRRRGSRVSEVLRTRRPLLALLLLGVLLAGGYLLSAVRSDLAPGGSGTAATGRAAGSGPGPARRRVGRRTALRDRAARRLPAEARQVLRLIDRRRPVPVRAGRGRLRQRRAVAAARTLGVVPGVHGADAGVGRPRRAAGSSPARTAPATTRPTTTSPSPGSRTRERAPRPGVPARCPGPPPPLVAEARAPGSEGHRGRAGGEQGGAAGRGFARALRFPDWVGRNWDALADALGDLSWLPAGPHVVVWAGSDGSGPRSPSRTDGGGGARTRRSAPPAPTAR